MDLAINSFVTGKGGQCRKLRKNAKKAKKRKLIITKTR